MRRRLVRGGLVGAVVLYGAMTMIGSSSAQTLPPEFPDITFPSIPGFTIPTPTTSPPPTMPPPTTTTTSPPPTMPPSTSPPTSSPPPTMPPITAPSSDELAEEVLDRFEDIADNIREIFEAFGLGELADFL